MIDAPKVLKHGPSWYPTSFWATAPMTEGLVKRLGADEDIKSALA
jgi:hypothetical protein